MAEFKDPYSSHRFLVEIDGIARASFSECTGFDSTVEVTDYQEGGYPTVHKIPARTTYSNIQLKWGMSDDTDLYEWHMKAVRGEVERKNGSIVLMARNGEEVARWNFERAWPTKYDGPDLNASSNDLAIETLEIVHEGLERA